MSTDSDDFEIIQKGRACRHRTRRGAPGPLPQLRPRQQAWLISWASSHQASRSRESLYKAQANIDLEEADALVDQLLHTGWISLRETLQRGVWLWQSLQWLDLPTLQSHLNLPTAQALASELTDWQASVRAWLQALTTDHPLRTAVLEALADLESSRAPLRRKRERVGLLRSACVWFDEGRTGHRRDFALMARHDTKSITDTEWEWLDRYLGLSDLGIQSFVPMLWIAGPLLLKWGDQSLNLSLLSHQAIPIHQLLTTSSMHHDGPLTYWLIENRVSFERQVQRHRDKVLVWMPGRPTQAWLKAIDHLLDQAPGNGLISADIDPSGLEIVMTASQPWTHRQLNWQMQDMTEDLLRGAARWPLSAHDQQLLDGLLGNNNIPVEIRALAHSMRDTGSKAEQEGWL
jgi:hypothetical protein